MITQETLQAIVNYLATRPYADVVNLFNMIQKDMVNHGVPTTNTADDTAGDRHHNDQPSA